MADLKITKTLFFALVALVLNLMVSDLRAVTATPSPTPNIVNAANAWSPTAITVTAGTTVIWEWTGFHSVESDSGLEPYSSGAPSSGGYFTYTFNTIGTFGYYCGVHGAPGGTGMYGYIYVIAAPTPTITATFSVSPTTSQTFTQSQTHTFSPTVSETPTALSSITDSPTITASPTISETPTAMSSITDSPTITASPTISETPTAMGSVTDSPTITASPTISETPTAMGSVTDSPTITASPTISETPTAMSSVTDSPVPSATPTSTETATSFGTTTNSPSVTASQTASSSVTLTQTFSATETASISPTVTFSPTITLTQTWSPGCTTRFGMETSTFPGGAANVQWFSPFVQPTGSVINILEVLVVDASPGGSLYLGLYSDSGGLPQNLLAGSLGQELAINGWVSHWVPDLFLPAGNYWLSVSTQNGIQMGANGPGEIYANALAYGPMMSPVSPPPGLATNSAALAMRAAYCDLGSPTPSPTFSVSPTDSPTALGTFTATPTGTISPTPTQYIQPCAVQFGQTSGSGGGGWPSEIFMSLFNFGGGNVNQLSAKFTAVAGGTLRLAMYENFFGAPTNLIAGTDTGDILVPAAPGWFNVSIPDTFLAAGSYWIAYNLSTGGNSIDADLGSGGIYNATVPYGPMPDPAPAMSVLVSTVELSLTASDCPAGTFTSTPSPSFSPSPTVTPSFTISPSSTVTITNTSSPTYSASPTMSSTLTPTATHSPSPSRTATPSFSVTISASPTATISPSVTLTPTSAASLTSTQSPSPSVTATLEAPQGPPAILQALAAPNPASGKVVSLSILIQGFAKGLKVTLYSSAMQKLLEVEDDVLHSAGWHERQFDTTGLASGLYYFVVQVPANQGFPQLRKTGKVYLLP